MRHLIMGDIKVEVDRKNSSSRLMIFNTTLKDAGKYTCAIRSETEVRSASTYIQVLDISHGDHDQNYGKIIVSLVLLSAQDAQVLNVVLINIVFRAFEVVVF